MRVGGKVGQKSKAALCFTGRGGDAVEEPLTDHGLAGSKWCNEKGYWDNRSFVRQVNLLIRIVNIKYPNHQMVLVVDNSSGHYAVGDSGLNASGMNMSEGGKQHRLDDGFYFTKDAAGFISQVVQPICASAWTSTNSWSEKTRMERKDAQGLPCLWYKHITSGVVLKTMPPSAKAKGLKWVLRERFHSGALYKTNERMTRNPATLNLGEMREEMARFADFSNQRSRVELLCESLGHVCLFLPKFHPELNPIELNWRDSKNELRRNCTCSSVGFKQRWHAALDAITPEMIRKYFKSAMEYEMVYDKVIGLGNQPDPDATVQKYKSHRSEFRTDSVKTNAKTKMVAKVALEDRGKFLVKVKIEEKQGKRCKEDEYTVVVPATGDWGLLHALVRHLEKKKVESEAMLVMMANQR